MSNFILISVQVQNFMQTQSIEGGRWGGDLSAWRWAGGGDRWRGGRSMEEGEQRRRCGGGPVEEGGR
jgi:hypothetical protein